jgi:hypothetical protein
MISIDIDHFRARILQDALTEATAAYWLHRAEQFEAAAPQPTDYSGHASQEELAEAWVRCKTAAITCRRHAELIMQNRPEPISDEVASMLEEVA